MRLTDKTERYSMGDREFVGRKKNYIVGIHFSAKKILQNSEYWWYSLNKKDAEFSYNSLWDGLKYKTQEECVAAAENKVDELVKQP